MSIEQSIECAQLAAPLALAERVVQEMGSDPFSAQLAQQMGSDPIFAATGVAT